MFKLLGSTSSPLISNKAISLFIESLNSKEPRKSISSVSSLRKSSQVSTEELAGKEALSRQYVQDNTKRPTSTNKAGSSGAQITPKSGIAAPSNRTGIPGLLNTNLYAAKGTWLFLRIISEWFPLNNCQYYYKMYHFLFWSREAVKYVRPLRFNHRNCQHGSFLQIFNISPTKYFVYVMPSPSFTSYVIYANPLLALLARFRPTFVTLWLSFHCCYYRVRAPKEIQMFWKIVEPRVLDGFEWIEFWVTAEIPSIFLLC